MSPKGLSFLALHPIPSTPHLSRKEEEKEQFFLSPVSGSVSPPGHLLLLVSSLASVSEWQERRQSSFLFLFQRGLGVGLAQSAAG